MKGRTEELRFRVPPDVAEEVEKWAEEKYPKRHGNRQWLLADLLAEALQRRRDSVRVQKRRVRRTDS